MPSESYDTWVRKKHLKSLLIVRWWANWSLWRICGLSGPRSGYFHSALLPVRKWWARALLLRLCFFPSLNLAFHFPGWKTHRYPGVKKMFPELTKISSNTQWPACPCSFPESSLKHLTPRKAWQWPNQTKCSSVWRRFPNTKWKLVHKWSQTPRRSLQSRNRLQNKMKNPKQVQAHLFVANGLLILLKKICGLETWTMLVGHPQIFSLSNNLCSLFPQYFHFYLMN